MLAMLARLTLSEMKNKKSSFCGPLIRHTREHSRNDQIKLIVNHLHPARVSHHGQAYIPLPRRRIYNDIELACGKKGLHSLPFNLKY